ncbi:MAG: peptidase M22 [Eubacterium sp.]|nr:peptidase M22 [Candidatus Colimonas fimequi]
MNSRYILGIDTSNYKTSVAVIDSDYNIIYDSRRYLDVKKGERGLRQSEALFQHVNSLPKLIEKIPIDLAGNLDAVAWSSRPRPVDGSYMPVFNAGVSFGRSIAAVNGIQGIGFSHQEGHIEAIRMDADFPDDEPFLACHFSGGTTELLIVQPRQRDVVLNSGIFYKIQVAGGTRDIAFGQVIDRAGVAMGIGFPAGEVMDKLALNATFTTDYLTPIKTRSAFMNLSGIDTQIKRIIEEGSVTNEPEAFVSEIFTKLTDSMEKAISQAIEMSGINRVIMAGGVTSSRFIRNKIENSNKLRGADIQFGREELSQDNAVGIAVLGGRYVWD